MNLILPQGTLDLLERVPVTSRHPGLQLDKFSVPGDQTVQKQAIEQVIRANDALANADGQFQQLRQRWISHLQPSGTVSTVLLHCTTTGPLTLHLSRASALEKAGICLHPLYGFVYIPGSGLKGMARALAETVWLPTQLGEEWPTANDDQWNQALDRIEGIFGYGPYIPLKDEARKRMTDFAQRLDDHKCRRDKARRTQDGKRAHVGNIVFHDAWPESWPKLIVDIVNNHHPDYYQHNGNQHPPGDWENPVPVYFPAAAPGVTFTFPLAKRRADVADELQALASEWLLGALCHLGAGAKTNAGYGAFRTANDVPPSTISAVATTWKQAIEPSKHRAEFPTTLELVTPAFLAGANQQAEDCALRRSAVTSVGSGVRCTPDSSMCKPCGHWKRRSGGTLSPAARIVVDVVQKGKTIPFPAKQITKNNKNQEVLRLAPKFAQSNQLQNAPQKRTQGVLYLSFGMDEMPAGKPTERKQRWCMLPGAKWNVTLKARDSIFEQDHHHQRIPADQVLVQAKAALSLLCQFGGVGSKGRNGFGSLGENGKNVSNSLDNVLATAVSLRGFLSLPNESKATLSSSLNRLCEPLVIMTPWSNYWFVLDQLGFSIQGFCQSAGQKRSWVKEALGLPRKIGTSDSDGSRDRGYSRSFDKQTKQGVVWLGQTHPHLNGRDPKDMRHASPVHIHLNHNSNDTFSISIIAFPCSVLPAGQESEQELKSLFQHLKSDLKGRAKSHANTIEAITSSSGNVPTPSSQPQQPAAPSRPQPGQRVEAKLLAEKTRKGDWKAKHELCGLSGSIQNTGDVPSDKTAGDPLTLIVASANEREIAFRYPTAADNQRSKKGKGGK